MASTAHCWQCVETEPRTTPSQAGVCAGLDGEEKTVDTVSRQRH